VIVLNILHTLVAAAIAVVGTIGYGAYGAVVGFIPPRGDWTLRAARWWGRFILGVALSPLRREGVDNVPGDRPVVFMANHESWMDIPALLAAVPVQVRFLAKKSLFGIPFFGWAIAAMGFIPVDRENRRTAVKSFDEAAARIRAGRSVLIFPEETRTVDDNLLPFQRGGFLIAIKAGIPIVPVGLDGPRRVMPRRSYLVRPHPITVRFGAPIPTAGRGVTEKEALMVQVHAAMESLRRPAPAAQVV
jgi:1-acyl-sn-glycerol-3-phosphate acyltransferase